MKERTKTNLLIIGIILLTILLLSMDDISIFQRVWILVIHGYCITILIKEY